MKIVGILPDKRKLIAVAILLGLILFFGGAKYYQLRLDAVRVENQVSVEQEAEESAENEPVKNEEEKLELLAVHVVGAVEKPGVYMLADDKRVNDAVQLALPTSKADLSQINMAAFLEDGKQIYVPAYGEKKVAVSAVQRIGENSSGLINLNTASPSELDRLPGIGPALAERIIAYREQYGLFDAIEDVTKVSGIGPSLLEKIRSKVTVR